MTIVEQVNQLKDSFQEGYGEYPTVGIYIHHLTREKAMNMAYTLKGDNPTVKVEHSPSRDNKDTQWYEVILDDSDKGRVRIVLFYRDETQETQETQEGVVI